MTSLKSVFNSGAAFAVMSILTGALCARATAGSLQEGIAIDLGGRAATLKRLDTLPYVESDYSRRFKFDSSENPKLKELRTRHKLDDVVAPGKDEFDRQVLPLLTRPTSSLHV